MGTVVKLPVPVSWSGPSSDLSGEVVLFSLKLLGTGAATAESKEGEVLVLSRQLYTYGVLKHGTSVDDNMTAVQPMRPLLEAPAARCTLSAPTCNKGKHADSALACTTIVSNEGTVPCLYMELDLSDPSKPGKSQSCKIIQ